MFQVQTSYCANPSDDDCPSDGIAEIEDPFDCYNFYLCIEGVVTETTYLCETGTFFDVESCQCIAENNTTCTDKCFIEHECSPHDCSTSGVVAYADDSDCSKYFLCDLQDNPISATCQSPNLYFDGEECTNDPSECCTITECEPYCGAGSEVPLSNVADPCDCTSYYLCENEYSVPTIRGSCPTDQVFDGSSCSDTASCEPICTDEQCALADQFSRP